jgi:hypothetical protein
MPDSSNHVKKNNLRISGTPGRALAALIGIYENSSSDISCLISYSYSDFGQDSLWLSLEITIAAVIIADNINGGPEK